MIPISELNLIKIGEITKVRGFKGEVRIHTDFYLNLNQKTEHVFLQIDGYMVPFFFSEFPIFHKNDCIAKFDEVSDEKQASELIGCQVFCSENDIVYPENDSFENIQNFDVFNNEIYLGKASGFTNIPSNPILEVSSEDGLEILIPFNNEFLLSIDEKAKIIVFNLPEGLTDINK